MMQRRAGVGPGLELDLEVVAAQSEVVDIVGSQHILERGEHGPCLYAQQFGLFPGQTQAELRRGRIIGRHGEHGLGTCRQVTDKGIRDAGQRGSVDVPDAADVERGTARGTQPHDGRRREGHDAGGGDVVRTALYLSHDGRKTGRRRGTLLPGVQFHDAHGRILPAAAEHAHARDLHDGMDAGDGRQTLAYRGQHCIGTLLDSITGQFHIAEDDALVFHGQERWRDMPVQEPYAEEGPAQYPQCQSAAPYKTPRHAQIAAAQGVQEPVDGQEDWGTLPARPAQDQGAQGRAERQRHHGGKTEGHAHAHRELAVDGPHHAAVKSQGRIAGHRDQGRGDDGPGDLLHAFYGCLPGGQAFALHDALRVLHHHDGIVHQGTDDEDQAEHGQSVDAVSQGVHDAEGPHQRHGDGHRRDERGPPVLDEQPRHQNDQDQGHHQGGDHLPHGCDDELGRVIGDGIAHTGRKALLPGSQLGLDAVHGRQSIGIGAPVQGQAHTFLAVEGGTAGIAAGSQFHGGHVPQAYDPATVGIGADDDLAEFFRRLEAPLHIELVGDVAVAAFGPQCARGRLHVLRLHGAPDLAGRDAEPGHAQGLHPDAHGVFLLRHHVRRGDPLQTGQGILDVVVYIVDQLVQAQGGTVSLEGQHGQDVVAALLHRDADFGHLAGQLGFRPFDSILQVDKGDVGIRAGAEGHRAGIGTGIAAGGRKVQQILHAVDLVLQRHGHGLGHHVGTGPGIGGRNEERGGRDLGIFRHRQIGQRYAAGQQQDQAHHGGKTGTLDKDTREHASPAPRHPRPCGYSPPSSRQPPCACRP